MFAAVESALKRFALWLFAAVALTLRQLRFLHPFYPRTVKDILRTWTGPMLWVVFKSFGRRIHVDEPCGWKEVSDFTPRAAALPEFALSSDQIRCFFENGYLGPFRALAEEEIPAFRRQIGEVLAAPSPIYGFQTTRDHHLDSPLLGELIRRPAVVERIKQLMGENLLVWRSNVFEKRAGSPEITWHQGTTFLMEQVYKPAIEPDDPDSFFEIAIWVAIDPATTENGCMQVVPGTHREIGTIRLFAPQQFLEARFVGDYDIDPRDVVDLPCRPGEFYIFSERVIHGSQPNGSGQDRMSFVARYIKPATRIYRGETTHRVNTMKRQFRLDRWGCVLVHGQDDAGVNKVLPAAR